MSDITNDRVGLRSKVLVSDELMLIMIRFVEVHNLQVVFEPIKSRANFYQLWEGCAAELNLVAPTKSVEQWRRFWVTWKSRMNKRQTVLLSKEKKNLPITESEKLSPMEERLIALMDGMDKNDEVMKRNNDNMNCNVTEALNTNPDNDEWSKRHLVNAKQKEVFTNFLELHAPRKDFFNIKLIRTHPQLWKKCTAELNAAGPKKTIVNWRRFWGTWIQRINKRRTILLSKENNDLEIAESDKLSPIEERLISLVDNMEKIRRRKKENVNRIIKKDPKPKIPKKVPNTITVKQKEIFSKLLDLHGPRLDFFSVKLKGPQYQLWKKCAAELNAAGINKSPLHWRYYWKMFKYVIYNRKTSPTSTEQNIMDQMNDLRRYYKTRKYLAPKRNLYTLGSKHWIRISKYDEWLLKHKKKIAKNIQTIQKVPDKGLIYVTTEDDQIIISDDKDGKSTHDSDKKVDVALEQPDITQESNLSATEQDSSIAYIAEEKTVHDSIDNTETIPEQSFNTTKKEPSDAEQDNPIFDNIQPLETYATQKLPSIPTPPALPLVLTAEALYTKIQPNEQRSWSSLHALEKKPYYIAITSLKKEYVRRYKTYLDMLSPVDLHKHLMDTISNDP